LEIKKILLILHRIYNKLLKQRKMVNLHSTQTKKTYVKPHLVKRGSVAKLTKGQKGGSTDFQGLGGNIG